jgi:hypothetical protein
MDNAVCTESMSGLGKKYGWVPEPLNIEMQYVSHIP